MSPGTLHVKVHAKFWVNWLISPSQLGPLVGHVRQQDA